MSLFGKEKVSAFNEFIPEGIEEEEKAKFQEFNKSFWPWRYCGTENTVMLLVDRFSPDSGKKIIKPSGFRFVGLRYKTIIVSTKLKPKDWQPDNNDIGGFNFKCKDGQYITIDPLSEIKITDPWKYMSSMDDPMSAIKDRITAIVGAYVASHDKEEINAGTNILRKPQYQQMLTDICNRTGIKIESLIIKQSQESDEVKKAEDERVASEIGKETARNKAASQTIVMEKFGELGKKLGFEGDKLNQFIKTCADTVNIEKVAESDKASIFINTGSTQQNDPLLEYMRMKAAQQMMNNRTNEQVIDESMGESEEDTIGIQRTRRLTNGRH